MSPSRRLLAYVGRYRGAFFFGFVCIVATSAITLAGPWVLKYAIDDLTRSGLTGAKLGLYGGAILGLAAVVATGSYPTWSPGQHCGRCGEPWPGRGPRQKRADLPHPGQVGGL